MKIKSQFYLLVVGIVIIPVVAIIGSAVYVRFISPFGEYREEFRRFIELAGLPEPSIIIRLMPLIFMLFIIIFVTFMSLFIARSITGSVATLENTTRRIADGELDMVVGVKGSNEIISLANSFNKLRNVRKEEEHRRYFNIMGITHDLKIPLALIKANVDTIKNGIIANLEGQKHSLNVIDNKVGEMEGMINNILDFVSMDGSKTKRNIQVTDLRPFLFSFIEHVTVDAELLRHKIETNINLPANLTVNMDRMLVQRALDNIVYNSFRYTPDGACLFITADVDGLAVKLTISDNGNGINQKDLPYIFDIYYRGSESRGEKGSGMGLAVAKSIIDLHGWSISVSTERGKGAYFTITIPLTVVYL